MTSTKRILIVDDDEDLAEALAQRCRLAGFCVETAHDGTAALHKVNSFDPGLLVLDVNMPCGSGLAVCEMIARDEILATIPVIVLTGRKDVETRERCQILRAQYVAKCPDVWLRLEPLIKAGLGLPTGQDMAVKKIRTLAVRVRSEDRLHAGPPSIHFQLRSESGLSAPSAELREASELLTEEDRIQERYIDTVFSAFAGHAAMSDTRPELAQVIPPVSRPRVLCIDDDSDLLNSLRLRLEKHGIETNQATRGIDGYLQAFLGEMQAIILDYEMPNGNGEYVLRRLKENPITSNVPVIVLSGRKDRALERTLSNMGAAKYLTKPVEWDKLIGELQRYVPMTPQSLSL